MKKAEAPEISVIMSVYNQWNKEQLDEAIMSVLCQNFTDFEFIIYNDGSDQAECEYLRKYARIDSRIVLIENPVNHGLAYSLNNCIDVARGRYLARMDADDICDPERFSVQYNFLKEHPEIAYVGCNAYLVDKMGKWGVRKMPENPDKRAFLKYSPYIHPTVMIRRTIFDDTEAYRSSKETWRCEDYELFMRLCKLGHRGCNIQQPLFFYREDRNSYKKRKWKYRVDEMRLRYRNFNELKILYPFGWWYVIRPFLAGIVPGFITLGTKKLYYKLEKSHEKRRRKEIVPIPENFEKSPGAV